MENSVINKITVCDDISVITVTPPSKMPHLAYSILCELANVKINLLMINGTFSNGEIIFAVFSDKVSGILKTTAHFNGTLATVSGENSKISIFGESLDRSEFIVKKILDPLSEYNADIRIVSVSSHEISLIMPTCKTDTFLKDLTLN